MPHEIYYTSASEGVKRGAQGFCTVAATEGIPPALLQRLEALSGYRHHAAPGDRAAADNPVTFAHWTLALSGKTYYVLSRICDAGFDYTHRTNSLAHHMALEAGELPPAGPAWLLAQPGVMIGQWDGRVGTIRRASPLPFQNASPARCDAWESLTGDAGWGGVLADLLSRGASKPACILFAPGQDILRLIAESIRLLPFEKRWQATFNTYFTSMPTSVSCAWRCCAVGTPAATAAIRYAANGLLINLADPAALGAPPNSPWVTVARTGVAAAVQAPSKTWKAPPAQSVPLPSADELGPPLELAPLPPQDDDEAPAPQRDLPRAAIRPIKLPLPSMPTQRVSTSNEINALARKQRRQMILLYSGAVLAIGFGVLVLVQASKQPAIESPLVSHPVPAPEPQEPDTQPVIAPVPVAVPPRVVVEQPKPSVRPDGPSIIPAPAPVAPEPTLFIQQPLQRVTSGSGLYDKTDDLELAPTDAARLRKARSFEIVFPGHRAEYVYRHGELSGTFASTPIPGPGFAVEWRDNQPGMPPAKVIEMALDAAHRQLHITWKSGLMLKRPDVSALAFWLIQNSVFQAAEPGKAMPHHLAFVPRSYKAIDLEDTDAPLQLPCDLPPDCTLSGANLLPDGWQTASVPDAQDKDQPAASLMLTRHTHVSVLDAVFHITVKAGWTGISNDFYSQMKFSQGSLAKFKQDRDTLDQQVGRLQEDGNGDVSALLGQRSAIGALMAKSDSELQSMNMSRDAVKMRAENIQNQIAARIQKLEADKTPLQEKRGDFDQLCKGYGEVIDAFSSLKSFDLAVTLPDGTAIAVLHFQHK